MTFCDAPEQERVYRRLPRDGCAFPCSCPTWWTSATDPRIHRPRRGRLESMRFDCGIEAPILEELTYMGHDVSDGEVALSRSPHALRGL